MVKNVSNVAPLTIALNAKILVTSYWMPLAYHPVLTTISSGLSITPASSFVRLRPIPFYPINHA